VSAVEQKLTKIQENLGQKKLLVNATVATSPVVLR